MRSRSFKLRGMLLPLGGLALGVSLMAMPAPQAPDNTRQNKDQSSTADKQSMNASDRATTQKIRKAIHEDKGLSVYAHNIKIVTRDGKVTLRGPVRSDEEKNALQAKAAEVAGEGNVTNDLQVAPPKN